MKKYAALFLLAVSFQASQAQLSRYIIRLRDKQFNGYSISDPAQYLSQRALDRRSRYALVIDSTDLPITGRYIDSLRLAGAVTILNSSKWLNQVVINTTDAAALAKINSFSFVLGSTAVASAILISPDNKKLLPDLSKSAKTAGIEPLTSSIASFGYGYASGQIKIHQGDFLHNHGFRGQGMQLAMLDAGFFHYQSLPTFDSIRKNNQVLGTWNFVNNNANVNDGNTHGMQCLSTIAADMPGRFIGTSPKTGLYLFVTEDDYSESPVEEISWAAGLERADSLGVDICSTSLGYTEFDNPAVNYTYADMNGHSTLSARAANMASQKGMLLVIANGNEGQHIWHYLTTPADADSALAIGAVDTTGIAAAFSSYGPSSDGDIKPGVASVGTNCVVADPGTGLPSYGSGTSFACPNMAGLVNCLWQAFPEINARGIIHAVEASATRADNPDDRTGYGIPDMKKAFVILFKKLYSQQLSIHDCSVSLHVSAKTDSSVGLTIERKTARENDFSAIKTFAGDGSNFSVGGISFTDNLNGEAFGITSYRIRVNIGTDTSFYMESSGLDYSRQCAAAENKITITPNPVTDYLNIALERTSAAKATIMIQNTLGQKIYSTTVSLAPGAAMEKIALQPYSRGVYFVSIFIDGKRSMTKKILLQ